MIRRPWRLTMLSKELEIGGDGKGGEESIIYYKEFLKAFTWTLRVYCSLLIMPQKSAQHASTLRFGERV
jgi:hypothetical protein